MTKVKKQVGRKVQKTNIHLPANTQDLLKSLEGMKRKAYMRALLEGGWTYQSIAEVFGVTRQAIEIYARVKYKSDEKQAEWAKEFAEAKALPIPELPSKPIYKTERAVAEAEAIAQLKELHAIAKKVRGRGKNHRAEADEFTRLAWEQIEKGISVYSLAKSLGITTGALMFRFVRYGYKTSNGKSKAYNKIKYKGDNK